MVVNKVEGGQNVTTKGWTERRQFGSGRMLLPPGSPALEDGAIGQGGGHYDDTVKDTQDICSTAFTRQTSDSL